MWPCPSKIPEFTELFVRYEDMHDISKLAFSSVSFVLCYLANIKI